MKRIPGKKRSPANYIEESDDELLAEKQAIESAYGDRLKDEYKVPRDVQDRADALMEEANTYEKYIGSGKPIFKIPGKKKKK